MGRPRIHADAAARQAAHRERNAIADIRLLPETLATIDSIASDLDVSRVELLNSMVNFALLNRNWRQLGLFGKRLPSAVRNRKASASAGSSDA